MELLTRPRHTWPGTTWEMRPTRPNRLAGPRARSTENTVADQAGGGWSGRESGGSEMVGKANSQEERALLISSDGHASAKMADYRPYIPASYRDEFDAFCVRYAELGIRSSDPGALALHLDPDILELWVQNMVERDRLSGF